MRTLATSALTGAAALLLAPLAAAQITTCQWQYIPGITYNLAPLSLPASSPGYTVNDVRDASTAYVFNVCGNVNAPASGNCGGNTSAEAWQVQYGSSTCYQLGQTANAGWSFSIYDPMYPARGVMLQYTGGSSRWCPPGRSRSLTVEVTCSPGTPLNYDYTSASVYETNSCDYHVELPSIAGCPTQCLTGSSVCLGNGVCGYNTDTASAQCFCYDGYAGGDCGTKTSTGGMSAEGIILIIVCIALAGVIGLVVFMFLKLRRLQVDPAAYGELEGKFNELGMLA